MNKYQKLGLCLCFLLLIFLTLKFFFFHSSPPPPPNDPDLEAVPIDSQYIVYFRDSVDGIPVHPDSINRVIQLLEERGDSVIRECMCKNMVLVQIPPGVDLQERRLDTEDDMGTSGDSKLGITAQNYPMRFKPSNNLPPGSTERGPVSRDSIDPAKATIIVAIIDTGLQHSHPDVTDHIWINQEEENGDDNADDDGNCIYDDKHGFNAYTNRKLPIQVTDGHGTSVGAKVVGQPLDSFPGNIELQLMDVRFSTENDNSDRDTTDLFAAVCGMRYAIKKKAKVIQASWGLYHHDNIDTLLGEVLQLARRENVTVVAAAGNHANNNDTGGFYPAKFAELDSFEHVISVGAYDRDSSKLAYFSNFGANSVLLIAPGANERASFPPNRSSERNIDGTSIAAPWVTRTISIIKAFRPEITPGELRKCLSDYTNNDSDFPNIKYGELDHEASLLNCL